MVIPEDLKRLFTNEKIFLPNEEYSNLLKGKETNFVFIIQNGRKQAVKLKLNPKYLKTGDLSIDNLLVILKPTQQLFVPKNIQAKLDELPHLKEEILNNGFAVAQFALGSDKVQDFYLRIHPYLNRIEAYPVNQVAVPAQLNRYALEDEHIQQLQNGKKIDFTYQNNDYSVQFDPMNKRFKVHLSHKFSEKYIPFSSNDALLVPNSIYQFVPFNDSHKVFSIQLTSEALDTYNNLYGKEMMVSDLGSFIEKNDFLKASYPEINQSPLNLFKDDALFKVEKPTNQFENHYDVPISRRLMLAGTKSGLYLQNESIYFAYKTQNSYNNEKSLEVAESLKQNVQVEFNDKQVYSVKR